MRSKERGRRATLRFHCLGVTVDGRTETPYQSFQAGQTPKPPADGCTQCGVLPQVWPSQTAASGVPTLWVLPRRP